MALEQLFQDMNAEYGFDKYEDSLKSLDAKSLPVDESESVNSCGFDCNICLDSVTEPVVTLCGHLYCWPCIYKWIRHQSVSTKNTDHQEPRCPVCKAHVSKKTLVPLYGLDGVTKSCNEKASGNDIDVPNRPQGPSCIDSSMAASNLHPSQSVYHRNYPQPRQHYQPYPQGYMASPMLSVGGPRTNVTHPGAGMFGEMVYARIFGNSETALLTYPSYYNLAGTTTPRVRRQIMAVDRSLSRLSFFLFCCMILCLLLF